MDQVFPYHSIIQMTFQIHCIPLKSLEKVFKDVSSWTELTVEMGRFIVSECGCYITKLMDKKNK